ncbi:threonine synthase [Lactobacillus kefiranofaciens]|uniref:Threonine synthase n=1 Tax=Lactobacillus kefiranofaciens TaxID=267818 RepID=A0AAX3UFP6_9LACO|nr:threonine synthase [Lactobacillus kefiranofaciens]AEG40167.1 Threonine synthase [Lactobacillus kefiranofaciens subsp. kefiranofaciens]KRM23097.1 threonine synthase [Lactobacillus kefiranofaciens subsp. kefiranofaciens DSM 5016 = JCM 6985]QFQ67743.1 threonine synthase [Lactobacillus kefiranofaciens subsp. kefiranofaciens]WGO86501.1 threonine synthase [Lactobacillus kefiranofaciens]WQH36177.1 threonine synthase [Lactobacillus kefiranofaciens]
MQYRSTRGSKNQTLNSPAAIIQGLAPDGGLYVPVKFPKADFKLEDLPKLSYKQIAAMIISLFFDDFSKEQIKSAVINAYSEQWDDRSIVPIEKHDHNFYMELFHGPTLAFKDIALQMLPQLMTRAVQIEQTDHKIIILTATSGDTGTASMRGFANQAGTDVIVFYPEGGVSPVQLKQMLSQRGKNLQAIAIKGNFDDAQTEVKKIFNDEHFKMRLIQNDFQFSSANSMNIGRLVPQISYYLYTYGQLVRRQEIKLGDEVNFTVPTGNFGDILAGYYAKKLGLPIKKLICASNENNVLTDFFENGVYDKRRKFHVTNAPAMDILVSSNLERLLFDLYDENNQQIASLMNQLTQRGHYQIDKQIFTQLKHIFSAGFATQKQVQAEIKRIYNYDRYVIDPHTAVGSYVAHQYQKQTSDTTKMIIISTASPYKFPETVYEAITGRECPQTGIPAIKKLHEKLGGQLAIGVRALSDREPHAEKIIEPADMEKMISTILNLK